MELKERLTLINQQYRYVSVRILKGWLYLRASLPDKKDPSKVKSQDISTHLVANEASLPELVKKVKELDRCIKVWRLGEVFDWAPWLQMPDYLPTPVDTIQSMWNKYVAYKSSLVSINYARSLNKVSNALAAAPAFPNSKIGASELRDWLLKNRAVREVKKYLSMLSTCFKWAVNSGYVLENHFLALSRTITVTRNTAQKDYDIQAFTAEERDLILSAFLEARFAVSSRGRAASIAYGRFLYFCFFSGCRLTEGTALQWNHIASDFSYLTFQQIHVRKGQVQACLKTQDSRQFPINEQMKAFLIKLKEETQPCESDYVFPPSKWSKVSYIELTSLNIMWRRVLTKLGIRYRPPRQTRHTFTTLCLEKGKDPKDISAWVGNSAPIIYKHYASPNRDLAVPNL